MKRISYKVFSNVMDIRQDTTSIDITNISTSNIYNHITETLYNRFKDYNIKINHPGKTITVNYKDE